MCIVVDLNELTVKRMKGASNQDVYLALRRLWCNNKQVQHYEFPVMAHGNPFDPDSDILLVEGFGWKVEGAESETE